MATCWIALHRPIRPLLPQFQEPRVSKRDIHGLMDEGTYMSEARNKVLDQCSTMCGGRRAGHGDSLRSRGEDTSYEGIEVRLGCLTCYQGN